MKRLWTLPLCVGLACLPAAARAGDWPQFRGPGGAGVAAETGLPAAWGADKNIQWKIKVPGVAWSSPITWGDKVFVTTAVSDKQQKPARGFGGGRRPRPDGANPQRPRGGRGGRGGFGGNRQPPDALYRWEVYCLNRADGKVVWKQLAVERKPTIPTHGTNTYASETPVTDGERVYAYFGMTGVFCFDARTGKPLWKKDLGSYRMMAGWGTGSSPALEGDRLFIQCDNDEKSFLVALDKKTGNELWRVDRKDRSSWSTPLVWRNSKRTELVCSGSQRTRSYDPATGKVLWELGGMTGAPSATPVADGDLLFCGGGRGGFGGFGGGGFGGPRGGGRGGRGGFGGSTLFAIKAGASGDLTLKEGETANAGIAWSRPKAGPSMASPVVYKGYLYVLEQRGGLLSCYEAKTGKPAYSKERLPQAGGFTSSPWAYDGKVFCLADDGTTFVVKAGPKFEVLGKNKLDEMFWSSPAAAGGNLLLRGVDYLYCIKR